MSVSSHVMGGDCTQAAKRTITHDMNGLCPWRHSACLADTVPDLRLGHRGELEMANDAVLTDEERAREAQHAVAARRRAVGVEDGLQTIQAERVEERPRLVAGLHQIDLEHHDIRLARGNPLKGGQLLA